MDQRNLIRNLKLIKNMTSQDGTIKVTGCSIMPVIYHQSHHGAHHGSILALKLVLFNAWILGFVFKRKV